MASYLVGNRIHVDVPGMPEGIPIVDEYGEEVYILPEDFDHMGRPDSDAMHWVPDEKLKPVDFLEDALRQLLPRAGTAGQVARKAMLIAGRSPNTRPTQNLIALAQEMIDNVTRETGEA